MNNLISMDKKYKTRDGLEARVLCIDNYYGDGDFPIIALVEGETSTYTVTGGFYSHKEDDNDLIEVPEEKELWLEVYSVTKNSNTNIRFFSYNSDEALRLGITANRVAFGDKYQLIATKKITYVEGESCL